MAQLKHNVRYVRQNRHEILDKPDFKLYLPVNLILNLQKLHRKRLYLP